MEMFERPQLYSGPNLDPANVTFRPRAFAPGVYALIANPMPRDNSGLIVGDKASLVIDAGVNGATARKIQQIARKLTDVPIRYLVNTNYHGDHTFGNYAFPDTVEIVAHRLTAESLSDLAYEKKVRCRNLYGNELAIADVERWRKPDRTFENHLELDLGGRVVHLWNFGPGNTPGDTIVYVPEEKIAWTGNFVGNQHLLPMLLEVGPLPYIETLARCKAALDIDTIVPGHGPLGKPVALDRTIQYLWALLQDVTTAANLGLSAEAAVEAVRLRPEFELPWWFPVRSLRRLMTNFQRLNVLFTYRELERQRTAPGAPQHHKTGRSI
ncbi:MAG TPA: MBL fold metallo-hydrolase [Bryobacteraceae bacterium]